MIELNAWQSYLYHSYLNVSINHLRWIKINITRGNRARFLQIHLPNSKIPSNCKSNPSPVNNAAPFPSISLYQYIQTNFIQAKDKTKNSFAGSMNVNARRHRCNPHAYKNTHTHRRPQQYLSRAFTVRYATPVQSRRAGSRQAELALIPLA